MPAEIRDEIRDETREPMPGLPADEIATVIGIAEEYGVDGWKLAADWSATRAWIEEVRALFAERRFVWPRTSWRWSDDGKEDGVSVGGWVLHYERPEQGSHQGRLLGAAPRSGQAQVGRLDTTLTGLPIVAAGRVGGEVA